MKHSTRAWGLTLLLILTALLAFSGCAKPIFSIGEKKLCKAVDGSGKPTQETTEFSSTDPRVCVWFRYRNAGPGQVVKAKFTHVDALGTESAQEFQTELKPGASTGVVELTGEEGGSLVPGKYTVELTNQSDVAYGPPLVFTVK
jgi:hypothetical protein